MNYSNVKIVCSLITVKMTTFKTTWTPNLQKTTHVYTLNIKNILNFIFILGLWSEDKYYLELIKEKHPKAVAWKRTTLLSCWLFGNLFQGEGEGQTSSSSSSWGWMSLLLQRWRQPSFSAFFDSPSHSLPIGCESAAIIISHGLASSLRNPFAHEMERKQSRNSQTQPGPLLPYLLYWKSKCFYPFPVDRREQWIGYSCWLWGQISWLLGNS